MEKITMLGVSNSGKTCFIYAMYDFMQRVRNGFTFITNDPDVDLDLNEGWESIAFDGEWPNGTTQTSEYDFTVMFKSRPIMEFSWCDYRGGAITEKSTTDDVRKLHQRISDSQCLIICIGADTIKTLLTDSSNAQRNGDRELRRLNALISNFARNNDRRIPVIITLTKADLYTPQEQPQLLGVIREYFSSLLQPGGGWFVAVVPVTLGEDLGETNANDQTIHGTIAPKNIHIPVMFFLHSILKEKVHAMQNRIRGIHSKREDHRQEIKVNEGRGFWDKLWNGDNTDTLYAQIDNLNDEEKNLTSQLKALEEVFANMKDMFDVCKIFYDGNLITIKQDAV